MSKTILITGAHGFIGRNVAKHFADAGWTVSGIGHGLWGKEEWRQWGISDWRTADITLEALETYAGSPEIIVHCAGSGSVGRSLSNPLEDFNRTVTSTAVVLEYMRFYNKDARLVYPSSAAVYGSAGDHPIKEKDAIRPLSPYGYHKRMAEELCESYARNFGLKIALIRFFSLFGRGLKKQLLWDACNKFICAESEVRFAGDGEETRDWVHINDAARLIIRLSQIDGGFDIYNGGCGRRVTVREVLGLVAKAFGNKRTVHFSGINKEGDPKFYRADMEKTFSLDWKPEISLEKGIKEYVQWFLEERK